MYFANPWGLLGLLALPTILIIHLYQRRYPALQVAGLHLWAVDAEIRAAGRRRDRLPITPSLILELLAALLLTLALAQPRMGDLQPVPHVVAVLDNSASMSATPSGGKSFRDSVIAELTRQADQFDRRARYSVILSGRRPTILAGPAADWETVQAQLDTWQPSEPRHDFQPAWDLAAQFVEPTQRWQFFTDKVPGEDQAIPTNMDSVSVGLKSDNVAITTARWTYESNATEGNLALRIANLGRNAVDCKVQGKAVRVSPAAPAAPSPSVDGKVLFEQTVSIPAGGEVPLETKIPGGLGQLRIEASSAGDALAVDNVVTLIEPKVRMLTVANVVPAEDASFRPLERVLSGIPDWQSGTADRAHLLIGLAENLPPSRRDLWWLGVGPITRTDEARKNATDLIGPYLLEKRNPLLDGVVLGGVIWGGAQPVTLQVVPLISAGKTPLLARLSGTQTTAYLLNADLSRPNLADSPDWPILMKNLFDLRRDALPGLRRWNYRLNEEVAFRLFEGFDDASNATELTLWHEGKSRPLARSAIVELPLLDSMGVYEIRDGERSVGEFAVNFHDAEESNLLALSPGILSGTEATGTAAFALDQPYSWLILLAMALILAALLADWRWLSAKPQTQT